MTYQPAALSDDLKTLPKLPAWVTSGRAETLETVAFQSGVTLTILDQLVSDPSRGVPVKLLANRLALTAASATSKLEGRIAREVDIRDAYRLTSAGEASGPDGDLLAFWRGAARLRITGRDWNAALKTFVGLDLGTEVDGWLQSAASRCHTHGPLVGCVSVMRSVLEVDDRAERVACLLSDVVLARVLNWPVVLPVSAQCLTKAILRDLDEDEPELAVQQRILQSIEDAVHRSRDLAQRVAALQAVAPKLRAKGSDAAVALFLSEDAVAPSTMLSPMIQGTTMRMTDRAARRLCDRLVELNVVHELTGRPTFRLYGIAS